MILPLKIALGVIAALLLSLGGTGLYAKYLAEERDEAIKDVGSLEAALLIVEAQAKEREEANQRLSSILQRRSVREEQALTVSRHLQEKINALSSGCVFSDDASGLLWEIYERTGGVQGPRTLRPTPSTADEGAPASDS